MKEWLNEQYGLRVREIVKLSSGSVQDVSLVRAVEGDFVCKQYRANRSFAAVAFEAEAIRYLTDRGFPTPVLIVARNGEAVTELGGIPVILFEYVKGDAPARWNRKEEDAVVAAVALLNRLTTGFRPDNTAMRMNYDVASWCTILDVITMESNRDDKMEKAAYLQNEAEQLVFPEQLPKGIVHTDFHPTNVLFDGDKVVALLDFDDCNYADLIVDLAYLIHPFKDTYHHATWQDFPPTEEVFEFERTREIISIYNKIRPLSDLEYASLFDALKLTILVDSLWFFERGSVASFFERDKLERLNRLGRETFLQKIREKEKE